jgi:hypothetical protein
MAALQFNISRTDADITYVRVVLENLMEEREVLKESMDEHRAFLTPARRVPSEI